jgi:hypothetical protein
MTRKINHLPGFIFGRQFFFCICDVGNVLSFFSVTHHLGEIAGWMDGWMDGQADRQTDLL